MYSNTRIFRDTIIFASTKILTILVSMIITMVLSKSVSLNQYGVYSQAILIGSMFTSATILGLSDATNFFYNRSNSLIRNKYISVIISLQLALGIFSAILIFLLKDFFSLYFDNIALLRVLPYILFIPLLVNEISILQILFLSIGKSYVVAIKNLIISIIKLFVVLFITRYVRQIDDVLLSFFVIELFQAIYMIVYLVKHKVISIKFSFDFTIIKEIVSYSFPLALVILVNAINRDVDKFIIGGLGNTETLAIYANASRILPFDVIAFSLATILIPFVTKKIAEKRFAEVLVVYNNYMSMSAIFTWILAFGAIIFASNFITFLYGAVFLPGKEVFIIYLIVDMIRFANVSIILSASGKSKVLFQASAGSALLNIPLSIMLYFLIGIAGPALATLVSTIIFNWIIINQSAKILSVNWKNFFNGKVFIKILSFLCFSLVFVSLYDYYIGLYLSSNFANLFFSYGIYLSFAFAFFHKDVKIIVTKLQAS